MWVLTHFAFVFYRMMEVVPPPPQGEGQRAAEGCEYLLK